jgi:hypothetical protein
LRDMRIQAELADEAEGSENQQGDHSRSMVLLESLSHVPEPVPLLQGNELVHGR